MKLSDLDLLKLIPIFMREDETVKALAGVVNEYTQRVDKELPLIRKWDQIDRMDDQQLDEMAWELNVLWYDSGAPIETKRRLIKKSDMVYARLGTKWAVEEIVAAYFGSAQVLEWFEYDGRPHYFKIICGDPYITQEEEQRFLHALDIVKRKSQWLEAIVIQLASTAGFFVGSTGLEAEISHHVFGSGKIYRFFGVAINDATVEAVTILPAVDSTELSTPALYYGAYQREANREATAILTTGVRSTEVGPAGIFVGALHREISRISVNVPTAGTDNTVIGGATMRLGPVIGDSTREAHKMKGGE